MEFDTNVDLSIHWNSFEMWTWTKCPTFYRVQSVKCWPFCSGSHCINCLHKSKQHWHARSNTRPNKRYSDKQEMCTWHLGYIIEFALLFTCICYMRLFHIVLWYNICRQSWWIQWRTTSFCCCCISIGTMLYIYPWSAGRLHWTHWGRDKMAAIWQPTFSHAFTWMKMINIRLNVHWCLFPRVWLTVCQRWFRQWLGAE